MKAYIFPGQGAQFSGMGKELYESSESAKALFEKANEILGFDITKIMFEGTDEELKQTGVAVSMVHPAPLKNMRAQMEYTDGMFDHLMNKYEFGNMNDPSVYLDETNTRMTMNLRSNFSRLSSALIVEGKLDSARQVLDRIMIE